jgi:large subunit ribosomal protein L4
VAVVPEWPFATPRTKDAVGALAALGLEGKLLVVLGPDDDVAERCFANLPQVQLLVASELNTYDVLRNDWVVFTDATLPGQSVAGVPEVGAPPSAPAAADEAPAAEEPGDADGGEEK